MASRGTNSGELRRRDEEVRNARANTAGREDFIAEWIRSGSKQQHKRRREEGIPLLIEKFRLNLARIFSGKQQKEIADVALDSDKLMNIAVNEFVDLMVM